MIVPGRAHIGHIMRYVGRPLAILFAWDVIVTAGYMGLAQHWIEFPALPLTLLGSAVAVYLTFRNNVAYARWWEGRILWGSMVNYSRSFAREAKILLEQGKVELARTLVHRHIAYVHALRLHLRRQAPWDELSPRLAADEIARLKQVANVPNAILDRTGAIVAGEAELDSIRLAALESTMTALSNAQGGMERIKNTPLPQQYATYTVLFTHAFCLLLPLGMVESLGFYTPLGSTAAGFVFLALLQTGNDIQNPFENSEHDVPLTTITRSIEIDLRDGLGENHGLKGFTPEHDVLW
ncbi:bestrophin family protein [Frateuria aurantia]